MMEYGVALFFTMKHDSEKGYYEMDVKDCISGMVGLMCIGNGRQRCDRDKWEEMVLAKDPGFVWFIKVGLKASGDSVQCCIFCWLGWVIIQLRNDMMKRDHVKELHGRVTMHVDESISSTNPSLCLNLLRFLDDLGSIPLRP